MEIELLKKNMQPHFLLNTLTALSEVVEQSPREAVRLIDDLAEEFRTVARVSAEKLIPLVQELDLCRAHLRVMSVRTGHAWSLEAPGVDDAALVPPAVFLTLIENGFAHQRATGEAAAFRLTMDRPADGGTRYVFVSPGAVQTDSTRPAGGTGLRYVKARLEESFPGRWSLRGEPVASGWQTVIEIRKNAEGGRA
jgi:LytS/YehU family sensor histidine kinase